MTVLWILLTQSWKFWIRPCLSHITKKYVSICFLCNSNRLSPLSAADCACSADRTTGSKWRLGTYCPQADAAALIQCDLLLWEWWIRYSQWPVLCKTLPYYICYTQSSYQWDIRRHLSFSQKNITSEQEVTAMRMNVHCVVLVCTVNWAILWHGILCWRLFLHITYFSLGWIPCVSVLHVHVDIYG